MEPSVYVLILLIITILIGSLAFIFIYFNSGVKSKYSIQKESSIDSISITLSNNSDLNLLTNLLLEESQFYEIQTLEDCSENDTLILMIKIKFNNISSLDNLRIKIKSNFKNSKILFFNSPIY